MSQLSLQQVFERAHSSYNAGNFAQAESLTRQVLAQLPRQPDALHLLGILAVQFNRHDDAIELFQQAVAAQPANPFFYNSLGNIFEMSRQYDRAIETFHQALELDPNFAPAHGNLGVALHNRGRTAEALQSYARALQLDPNYADAHLHNAVALLLTGDFQRGWQEHEWRWHSPAFPMRPRNFPQPQWTGQPLAGKTILLHAEQGLGDTIHFARYIPLVADRHPKQILVETLPELLTLFQSIPNITLFPRATPLPSFDIHCPFMTLPLAFNTTLENIPHSVPYLSAPQDRIAHFANLFNGTSSSPGTRIGLVWAGNPNHPKDFDRSIPLSLLAPLVQIPNLTFISLQKGPATAQIPASGIPIIDLSPHLTDFLHAAALISNLDLVITVDTAVAHLAGALAKPTWLLLPHVPDWRWLESRSDSPWYPTMKLFRQPTPNAWPQVIEQLITELCHSKLK